MFSSRGSRERREIESEATKQLREESRKLRISERKTELLSENESSGKNAPVRLAYALIILISLFVGSQIGLQMNATTFLISSAILIVFTIALLFKVKTSLKQMVIVFVSLAVVAGYLGSNEHDRLVVQNISDAQKQKAAAVEQHLHYLEATRNHNRRLAWNLAHPLLAASLKAEARSRAAVITEREKALQDRNNLAARIIENNISHEAVRVWDSISAEAPGSVHSCQKSSDSIMVITVDADKYNVFGTQDQKLIRASWFMHWVKIWEVDHPDKVGESNLFLLVKDLVGADLGSFDFASVHVN